MVEVIYRCDLCKDITVPNACYKVYHDHSGVRFVDLNSPLWNETKNGTIICLRCVQAIQKGVGS